LETGAPVLVMLRP